MNNPVPEDAIPRPPLPTDGKPDPKPCSICRKTGHYFYDTLAHIDALLNETQDSL